MSSAMSACRLLINGCRLLRGRNEKHEGMKRLKI